MGKRLGDKSVSFVAVSTQHLPWGGLPALQRIEDSAARARLALAGQSCWRFYMARVPCPTLPEGAPWPPLHAQFLPDSMWLCSQGVLGTFPSQTMP